MMLSLYNIPFWRCVNNHDAPLRPLYPLSPLLHPNYAPDYLLYTPPFCHWRLLRDRRQRYALMEGPDTSHDLLYTSLSLCFPRRV